MSAETKHKIVLALYYDFINLPKFKHQTLGYITELFYKKYPEFK